MWSKRNCLSVETAVGGIEPPSPVLLIICACSQYLFSFLVMVTQCFDYIIIGCLFALYVAFMCYYGMRDKCVYELSDTY